MTATPVELEVARTTVLSLLDFARTTPRRRSPVEAAFPRTERYLQLEAAWALNRLGATKDAATLASPALKALRDGADVERALEHCYRVRLIEALDVRTPVTWPAELAPSWVLDPFPMYRASRLAEVYVLSPYLKPPRPVGYPNPLTDFIAGPAGWKLRRLGDGKLSWEQLEAEVLKVNYPPQLLELGPELVAHAQRGWGAAMHVVDLTKARWPDATDSFNTNDFYCLTVVRLFNLAVFSVVQAVRPVDLGRAL